LTEEANFFKTSGLSSKKGSIVFIWGLSLERAFLAFGISHDRTFLRVPSAL